MRSVACCCHNAKRMPRVIEKNFQMMSSVDSTLHDFTFTIPPSSQAGVFSTSTNFFVIDDVITLAIGNNNGNLTDVSTKTSYKQPYWSLPWRIGLSLTLLAILITAIVGNLLVIVVVARHRGMRTRTNIFLCNLAVSDFLCAIVDMPFSLATVASGGWPFGPIVCKLNGFAVPFLFVASNHTLMYIAVYKYLSIIDPIGRKRRPSFATSSRGVRVMIVCIWLWAALTGGLTISPLTSIVYKPAASQCGPVHPRRPTEVAHFLFFIITCYIVPLMVVAVCYARTFRAIRSYGSRLRRTTTESSAVVYAQQWRIATTLLLVVAMFVFSWTPWAIYAFCTLWTDDMGSYINPIAYWFGYLSSACNPIIYALRSNAFREGYKQVLTTGTKFKEPARLISVTRAVRTPQWPVPVPAVTNYYSNISTATPSLRVAILPTCSLFPAANDTAMHHAVPIVSLAQSSLAPSGAYQLPERRPNRNGFSSSCHETFYNGDNYTVTRGNGDRMLAIDSSRPRRHSMEVQHHEDVSSLSAVEVAELFVADHKNSHANRSIGDLAYADDVSKANVMRSSATFSSTGMMGAEVNLEPVTDYPPVGGMNSQVALHDLDEHIENKLCLNTDSHSRRAAAATLPRIGAELLSVYATGHTGTVKLRPAKSHSEADISTPIKERCFIKYTGNDQSVTVVEDRPMSVARHLFSRLLPASMQTSGIRRLSSPLVKRRRTTAVNSSGSVIRTSSSDCRTENIIWATDVPTDGGCSRMDDVSTFEGERHEEQKFGIIKRFRSLRFGKHRKQRTSVDDEDDCQRMRFRMTAIGHASLDRRLVGQMLKGEVETGFSETTFGATDPSLTSTKFGTLPSPRRSFQAPKVTKLCRYPSFERLDCDESLSGY